MHFVKAADALYIAGGFFTLTSSEGNNSVQETKR